MSLTRDTLDAIACSVRLEDGLSACERVGGGDAPPTQEVDGTIALGVWWKGMCRGCAVYVLVGNVCGLPVGLWWSDNFIGTGWHCFGCVIGVHQMDTFSSSATPLQQT